MIAYGNASMEVIVPQLIIVRTPRAMGIAVQQEALMMSALRIL